MMAHKIGQYFNQYKKYFKTASANDSNIVSWKSKGLSDESIKPNNTSNKVVKPLLNSVGTKARVKFNADCLKQEKLHLIMEKQ